MLPAEFSDVQKTCSWGDISFLPSFLPSVRPSFSKNSPCLPIPLAPKRLLMKQLNLSVVASSPALTATAVPQASKSQ